jgi:6-phosphogluconolactonase
MDIKPPFSLDSRRQIVIPGDAPATISFAVEHWRNCAKKAISDHGAFFVALSGGSTPKAIFEKLAQPPYQNEISWDKVHLFWGDERSTPPDDLDSNYHMAMESGLKKMPIPPSQIHRMVAERDIEQNAAGYEALLRKLLGNYPLDLIMLGMGDDGHTASLFPHTEGLKIEDKWVIANHIPQKNTWRMTLTYPCINSAKNIALYVIGPSKSAILAKVLYGPFLPDLLPSQKVGTPTSPALWIADAAAASSLPKNVLGK